MPGEQIFLAAGLVIDLPIAKHSFHALSSLYFDDPSSIGIGKKKQSGTSFYGLKVFWLWIWQKYHIPLLLFRSNPLWIRGRHNLSAIL